MKEIYQLGALVLGSLGIVIITFASVKLFQQIRGLQEIKALDVSVQKQRNNEDLYKDLIANLNDAIKDTNKLNEDAHKNNKLWRNIIVVGAIFELGALILSYCVSQVC